MSSPPIAPPRRPRRRALERGFEIATAACALGGVLALALVFAVVLARAFGALDWRLVLGAGGLRYQIVGTLILIATALAVAVPVAVAAALAVSVYFPAGRAREIVKSGLHLLNGVPAIVFGIAGLALFGRVLGWNKSWLAGGLVLALMILPTLTLALAERLAAVPPGYVAAARALGLSRDRTVWAVLLPQSVAGLVTGSLLGLARAAGETAPILFVAAVFSGATLPRGVTDSPVLALPYHVFVLAQDTYSNEARAELWVAAFVLLALVAALSLAALPWRLRLHEEARHG